ncbi:MAG: hypothetical protein ACTHU0_17690 [Kofleriaceae bacterium]
MTVDRLRVLVLALGSLALLVAALSFDWFVFRMGELQGIDRIALDLRTLHACAPQGMCASVDMGQVQGAYATLATATFWLSVLAGGAIALQAGGRLILGMASGPLTRPGYLLCAVSMIAAIATAYLFGPEVGNLGPLVSSERTWAPLMLIAGLALGIAAIRFAAADVDVLAELPPRDPPLPVAQAVTTPPGLAGRRSKRATEPAPAPAIARTTSAPIPVMPGHLRGKVRYAALTAELTRAGIDARREDGSAVLVMWRDVVGVVARRLPPAYDGATFIDVVSTAGSTLRILPWTRVTGETFDGDGEARARAIARSARVYCPELHLDAATAAFLERGEPAAQLPDLELLATHDDRLA